MRWYWYLIILVAALLILYFVVGFIIWKMAIPRIAPEKYENIPTDDPIEIAMREDNHKELERIQQFSYEDCWIKSKDGLNLHGLYHEASVKTNKVIISVHGWRGTAITTTPLFSSFLLDYNYNFFMPDLRSWGKSEGKYIGFGVLDSKDLLEWIDYIINRFNGDCSIALIGISMGGNTVTNVADKVPPQVKCIIDDCGYTSAFDEFHYVLKNSMHIWPFFLYGADLINHLIAHYGFKDADSRKALKSSRVPVLFIHGKKDTFVPTFMGKENYDACSTEKYLKLFDNANHVRSYFQNKEAYKQVVLDFLAKKF